MWTTVVLVGCTPCDAIHGRRQNLRTPPFEKGACFVPLTHMPGFRTGVHRQCTGRKNAPTSYGKPFPFATSGLLYRTAVTAFLATVAFNVRFFCSTAGRRSGVPMGSCHRVRGDPRFCRLSSGRSARTHGGIVRRARRSVGNVAVRVDLQGRARDSALPRKVWATVGWGQGRSPHFVVSRDPVELSTIVICMSACIDGTRESSALIYLALSLENSRSCPAYVPMPFLCSFVRYYSVRCLLQAYPSLRRTFPHPIKLLKNKP